MVASSAGTNGAATRSNATMSPVVNDPNTTHPMCPRGSEAEGDGVPDPSSGVELGTGIGVVATMDSIHCTGVARVQPSALVARAVVSTVAPSAPLLDPRSGPRFLVRLRGVRRPVDRPVGATTESDGHCPQTSSSGSPLCQPLVRAGVLGWVVAGPGSDF